VIFLKKGRTEIVLKWNLQKKKQQVAEEKKKKKKKEHPHFARLLFLMHHISFYGLKSIVNKIIRNSFNRYNTIRFILPEHSTILFDSQYIRKPKTHNII